MIPFAGFLGGIWAKVAAVGAVILAIVTFGAMKKREGKLEQQADDAEAVSEAQSKKLERDRAIRAAPAGSSKSRLRKQRDRLRKSVLRPDGTSDPE